WRVTFAWLQGDLVPGAGRLGLLKVGSAALEGNEAHVEVHTMVKGTDPLLFDITGLLPGVTYYVRTSAHNSRGYGPLSYAASAVPQGQPAAPRSPMLAVASGTALDVRWLPPASDGGTAITSYQVEWWSAADSGGTEEVQMVTTSAQKGVSEVQTVAVRADAANLGGNYKLSFDGYSTGNLAWDAPGTGRSSVKEALERLPPVGDVQVTKDYSTKAVPGLLLDVVQGSPIASASNASMLLPSQAGLAVNDIVFVAGFRARVRGFGSGGALLFGSLDDYSTAEPFDEGHGAVGVAVRKWAYGYEYSVTFASYNGDAPALVASASDGWSGTNPSIEVSEVTAGMAPIGGTFRVGFGGELSGPLQHDVDAAGMAAALEGLRAVGDVTVDKVVNGYGYNWIVTFESEAGDLPLLRADGGGLTGPSASVSVSAGLDGILPAAYSSAVVTDATILAYRIRGLTLGAPYSARVRAGNAEGYSAAAAAAPASLSPLEMPGVPREATLIVMSDAMLKVTWRPPASDGGQPVSRYRVEWDVDAGFANVGTSGFFHDLPVAPGAGSGDGADALFYNIVLPQSSSWLTRYARVRAYNSFAWGPDAYTTPAGAKPKLRPPGAVQSPELVVTSGVGLLVTWEPPSAMLSVYGGDGGSSIEEYLVEWDTSCKFDS
ncbi:unnamed protein product, partial [Phaeothamnion confervicola]